jgi:hypothetical protein
VCFCNYTPLLSDGRTSELILIYGLVAELPENSKLRNKNIILKGELSSCEEENYKLEKTINILKE